MSLTVVSLGGRLHAVPTTTGRAEGDRRAAEPRPRDLQREDTRRRIFDAAVAEIGRSGLAAAEVGRIVEAAGVARGTFYFHFPTKEHVLVELERAEETRIAAKLAARLAPADDLGSLFGVLVREVLASERRLGPVVFRDMLGLHFGTGRPTGDELADHPLAELVIAVLEGARAAGRVRRDADPGQLAVIFLSGLFALLAVSDTPGRSRRQLLDQYVTTIVEGMEVR